VRCLARYVWFAVRSCPLKQWFQVSWEDTSLPIILTFKLKRIYFQWLLQANSRQSKLFLKAMTVSERAQLASYEVAEMIALKWKSYVLAESVILPAYQKMVKVMLGDKAEQESRKNLLSNNTIQRRIMDLSDNTEQSVLAKLKIISSLYKSINLLTSSTMCN